MKVLLDTNIIIHREASKVIRPEIGNLFNWFDRLRYQKCVHPLSITEIRKHQDPNVVATFEAKIASYYELKTEAPETQEIQAIRKKYDQNNNDFIDTCMLKEVFSKRVDFLISEDRKVHDKASALGIADKVFTIETFLERVVAENPDLVNYKVLSVKKEYFGNLDINDPFLNLSNRTIKGLTTGSTVRLTKLLIYVRARTMNFLPFFTLNLKRKLRIIRIFSRNFSQRNDLKLELSKLLQMDTSSENAF